MEAFGGRIECTSRPGVQTTFTLRLPRFHPLGDRPDERLRTRTAG